VDVNGFCDLITWLLNQIINKSPPTMGYPTKMQLINRKASQQWYMNIPAAVAEAMEY